MSTWYEVEENNIDIDLFEEEISFFVCKDEKGSIYLTLSFNQIREILSKIEKK